MVTNSGDGERQRGAPKSLIGSERRSKVYGPRGARLSRRFKEKRLLGKISEPTEFEQDGEGKKKEKKQGALPWFF